MECDMKGIVTFLDKGRVKIDERSIIELDFKEECIIEESIKLFRDSDPCIIHRTFCANKIGMDILDELNRQYQGQKEVCFTAEELPDYIVDKINLPSTVGYIIIR
jgi:hypothetical protein